MDAKLAQNLWDRFFSTNLKKTCVLNRNRCTRSYFENRSTVFQKCIFVKSRRDVGSFWAPSQERVSICSYYLPHYIEYFDLRTMVIGAGHRSKRRGCLEPHLFRTLPRPNRLIDYNESSTKKYRF